MKYLITLMFIAAVAAIPLEMEDAEFDENTAQVKRQIDSKAMPNLATVDRRMLDMTVLTPIEMNGTVRGFTLNDSQLAANRQLLPTTYPNSPPCVYDTNCNFIGLDLYIILNVLSPLTCGNVLCSSDTRCTHFTHDATTNTCSLKSAPGSGGGWSTPVPSPSGHTCGHVPPRSCGSGSLISLCLGLNINLGGLLGGIL